MLRHDIVCPPLLRRSATDDVARDIYIYIYVCVHKYSRRMSIGDDWVPLPTAPSPSVPVQRLKPRFVRLTSCLDPAPGAHPHLPFT